MLGTNKSSFLKRWGIGLCVALSAFNGMAQSVDAGDDIFQCSGPVILNATVDGVTSSNNYTVSQLPTFAPEVIGGTGVTLGDDAVSASFPIGFSFCYYNNTYTNFWIGSNGWVSFTGGQPTSYVSASIPSTAANVPKNCIFGPWQDWHPGTGGQGPYIKYQTIGTAPNRKLVVTFDQIPMFSCTSTKGKFQIVLHETTNIIENHLWTKPACATWPGGNPNFSVQGIHNANGTAAVTVAGRNSASWTANNESWRYTPAGSPPIVWTNQAGQQVGTGPSITINTPVSGDFTATAAVCGGATYSDVVHVELTGVSINTAATQSSIQPSGCGNGAGSISLVVNNGIGPFDYEWTQLPNLNSPNATGLNDGNYQVTVIDLGSGCEVSGAFNVPQENSLNVSASVVNVTCPGSSNGQAAAIVNGNIGNVTYEWSGTTQNTQIVSGLSAGVYQLMVQDAAGCYDSINVTINEPPAIVINVLNMEDNACNGGAAGVIDVQATGGSTGAVFSYAWSTLGGPQFATGPSVGNLAAGTYVITASYLNPQGQTCTNPDTLEIFEPLPMDLSLVVGNIGCSGQATGSIEAVVANIVDPLSYAWSSAPGVNQSTINDLAPGNYSVTVTDGNGCTESESGEVLLVGNPMNLTSTVNHVDCFNGNDGTATINISGGTPGYVVNWPAGVNGNGNFADNLEAGVYTVQVVDANNCDMTLNVTVNEPSLLTVNIQNIADVLCYDQSNGHATASISGGTTNYQVLWSSGENSINAVAIPQGNFSVTVTDAHGCTATDSDMMDQPQPLTAVVGITEPSCFGGNDGIGEVTISGGTPNYTADWSNSSTNGELVNNLTAGNQSVTVTDANGCQVTQNFNLSQPAAMTATFDVVGDACGDLVASGAATVTVNGGTPNYSYAWDQGSSLSATQSNVNDGPIQVVVLDNNGCVQTFSTNIPVIETPVAAFTSNPEFDPLSTVISGYLPLTVSFDDQTAFGSSASWNWGDETQTLPAGTDVTHLFDSLGYHNVNLTVTGPGGCTSDLNFIVFVYDSAQIASFNFFTPNNDGYNDVYRVSCENFYGGVYYDCGEFTVRQFSGKILNRWGTVIYEWTDVNKGWDGKINGQPANEGQYLFLGNAKLYDGKEFEFQEWLNLSR